MGERFQAEWIRWARELGLRVDVPYDVRLGGQTVRIPVRLQDFGPPSGMLLVTEFSMIQEHAEELARLGYGFSCLTDPGPAIPTREDREAVVEMLMDWGWTGRGTLPSALRDASPPRNESQL